MADLKITTAKQIISRFCDDGFITNDEKSQLLLMQEHYQLQSAIFDLLMKKQPSIATRMFLDARSMTMENDKSQSEQKSPLENELVMRKVLSFLPLSDVKNCRLINKSWNNVVEPLMEKRSAITFGQFSKNPGHIIRSPVGYENAFKGSSTEKKYTAFRFEGHRVYWRITNVNDFFSRHKHYLHELTFRNVKLADRYGEELDDYDITDTLASLPSLTTLCVVYNKNEYRLRNLIITLNRLSKSVTKIHLSNCKVKIAKRGRISPIAFRAFEVLFLNKLGAERGYLDEYLLNDSVDFTSAKDIELRSGPTTLFFDLSKCGDLNSLILHDNIFIVNQDKAKLKVNLLDMGCPFVEKTLVKCTELHLSGYVRTVDAFTLPDSVERLYLKSQLEWPIFSNNLKFLLIDGGMWPFLTSRLTCLSIVDFVIDGPTNVLDVDWIPRSVKRIKLGKVNIICGLQFSVDTLVLDCVSLQNSHEILEIIKPKVLILRLDKLCESKTNENLFVFLQKFENLILYIDSINWDELRRSLKSESATLVNCVDKISTHYIFRNGQGEAIEMREFVAVCDAWVSSRFPAYDFQKWVDMINENDKPWGRNQRSSAH